MEATAPEKPSGGAAAKNKPGGAKGSRELTGMDKAAITLLSLEEESASEVLKLLDDTEIQRLTTHSTQLRTLSRETIDVVRTEFLNRVSETSPLLISQAREQLKEVLKRIMPPDRYKKFLEMLETGGELTEGFDSIRWIDAQTLATFLMQEHPQTIALVIAHLEPDKATEALLHIPKEKQADVVMRIAKLDRINPELVREIQEVMLTEIMASGASKSRQVGGAGAVASILNNLDGSTEELIFSSIEENDPEMAESIRELMFTFEDLNGLDARSIQMVMKEVTNDMLTMALKTAPEDLKEKMLSNISSRAADMIREELATMGPVKLSEVEKAQQEIVKICRRLEAEGKVQLGGGGGGEVFV
jgi:flagellar motor switch protein FliG